MNGPSSTRRQPQRASPRPAAELRVGGFVGLSTCDWPGELAATVFCQGCPWRCSYCHNRHLLPATREGAIGWDSVVAFMRTRGGLLDGLVFSGGEPTLQRGLAAAAREMRALGFRVGLHTAGPYPDRLSEILPLVDWVGFDVKAPFHDYARVTGVAGSGERARESLRRLLGSGVAHEVRTTVHPDLLDAASLASLAGTLADLEVRHYALQACRATDAAGRGTSPGAAILDGPLLGSLRNRFPSLTIRA